MTFRFQLGFGGSLVRLLSAVLLLASSFVHSTEVVAIAPLEKCFLCSSSPSLTMYWQGKDAKAVLMLIPGGEGHIGLRPGQKDHRYHFFQTLKRLTDANLSSGRFDVVLLDSPSPLSPNQRYPAARGSTDHMIRIESAIRHYKAKTGLPVWIMGHSNGGISLMEFLKYARKNDKMDLISGMVASGVRNESTFDAPISFPMLFIHHQQDGCFHTTFSTAFSNYEKVKQANTEPTEFVAIKGGEAESLDPCRSGFHMYYGAGEETAKSLDAFMSNIHK